MPGPGDKFWENIKKTEVEKKPTLAGGNLSGVTSANAKSASAPDGYYAKLNDKIKLDLFGDRSNWDKIGYAEQTNLELATNTFFGTLTNIAGGIVEGVASNDIKGIVDMSLGNTEAKYGNVLQQFANSIMEYGQENFHIYDDGSNSPFSFEYWGKQLQNTGYSAGIILEMFGEQALLAAATRGAGNAATLGTLASRFNRLKKIPQLLSKQAVFGSYQGIKEAYLNGIQTGEETYNKYKDIGFSDEEARQKANEAATLGFRMEALPLMALNSLQFAAIGKYNPFMKKEANLGFSGGFETLSDNLFKGVKNKYLRKLADYTTQAVAEGIEEGIQTGIGKEAQYQVGLASGIVGKQQLEDRLFEGDEMRDSIIGGALGGTLFRAIGKRFNSLTKGTKIAEQQQEYDNFLKDSAARVNADMKDLKEAFDSGDQDKVDVVRKRMQRNNVFEALKLDLINQKESAFDTYISTLEEMNSAISENDIDKMKEFGIDNVEDLSYIKDNYETFINDAYSIKDKLINNLQFTDDYNIAINLTNNEKTLEELSEFEQRSKSNINGFKTNNKQYSKLTSVGKQKFDLVVEQVALLAKAEQGQISQEQKTRLDEITSELAEIDENNKKYKGRASDKRILNSLNTEEIINEQLNILELQDYQDIISEKISYWKNPVNQRKEKVKAAKRKVEKAKSKEDLKEAKQELEQTETLTPEVEEIINDKIEQAEVKEITNPNDEAGFTTPFGDIVAPSEQEINQERSDIAQKITDSLINEKEQDFTKLEEQELFEPASTGEITPQQREKLRTSVSDYYESLKADVNKDPSFQEFVRDFIRHNGKETTDRIYNALSEGWKANDYKAVDFDKAYNEIFRDRKEISSDILDIAEDIIIDTPVSPQEVIESNKDTVERIVENKAPILEIDDNNRPILRDDNPFRTSVSTLKAAHLSIPYQREFIQNEDGTTSVVDTDTSDELNSPEYVNSNLLLNPDSFNPGTVLSVKIPDNYKEIKVATWEDDLTKGPSMTFEQWMRKSNIEEGSQEWLNKVPMIAYDQNGNGVFFVHDTQWYNMVNVGFKDEPQKQSQVITEARQNLNKLRNKVYNNGTLGIEITEKRPGTWKQIAKDQAPITLNEANPDTQLAIANDQGELLLNGQEFFETNDKVLINTKEFSRGHVYDIRKSTTSNEYIAFEVLRESVNEQSANTVKEVVKAYLYQYDEKNTISDNAYTKNLRNQVLNMTGLDIFDRADFENFINLYVPTIKGKFSGVSDIVNAVNSNKNIKDGSPFISIQKGSLVFGVKGNPISGNHNALYIHPKKITDQNGPSQMVSMLGKFEELLPNITQHISKSGLAENRTTVTIDDSGTVIPGNDYRTFLKDNLKTSVKSFNVGTKDNPAYATIIQPVINFKESQSDWKQFVDTGKVSETKVEEIADKIKTNQPLTSQEEAMRQEAASEVESKLKQDVDDKQTLSDAFSALKEFGVSEDDEAMKYLREELGDDFEPSSTDPITAVTNFLKDKSLTKAQEQEELVKFIDENGLMIPETFELNSTDLIGEGGEQQVFRPGRGKKVVKINQAGNYKSWKNYMNSLSAHNLLFPDTKYDLVGFALLDDSLAIVVEQDFVRPNSDTSAKQVQEYLEQKGFTLQSSEQFDDNNFYHTYTNPVGTLVSDINNDNVYTKDGKLYFIDTIVEVNSEELFEPISDVDVRALKEEISGTNGLSIIQDFQVVDYVFNELSSKIDFKYKSSVNKEQLLDEVKQSYLNLIEPKKNKNQLILDNLNSLYQKQPSNERLKVVIDKLQNEVEIFDIIKDNWTTIEDKALEKLYRYTGVQEGQIKEDDTDVIDDTIEKEKNYSKSSLEENGKSTSSYRLKRFLAGIKQIRPDGQVNTGFLGVPTYVGFDTAYSTIEQIISSPSEVDSNFDLMLARLEENVDTHKWLQQVIDNLKVADEQIKNEFVYNFARHTLSMKFTMFSKNRDDSWTLKVYDTNANEVTRVIRRQWESNFKQSPLVYIEDGQYKVSKERAKYLLDTFNGWQNRISGTGRKSKRNVDITNAELQNWLGDFGIYLSNEALNELRNKEIQYVTNDGKVKMSFGKMFEKSSNTAGIFGLLADYLEGITKKADTNFEENPDNHPFSNANNVLKTLGRIESKYALYATTNSFRDGGKSIYGFTPTKHATDVVKNLKFNQDFRDQLNNKSFNKHSYILNALNNDEAFREKFYVDHLGITALKELGKRVFGDNSITSLSDSDHELTKLGLFQDVEQGEINQHLGENNFVKLRMARMFLPTMSDKSQMLGLHTAVLDLKNKHFTISENGEVSLTQQLKEIAYSQLVKPELERIVNFNSSVKKTNIKGYDTAAQMFLFVPELNNLKDPTTGKRLISLMSNEPATYNMQWFEENFKESAKDIVESLIQNQVDSKISEWETNGFVKNENDVKSIEFMNKKYFDRFNGSLDEKIKIAANDYVINSLLTNANSYMLIAGDIAMYSQDKIQKYFQNGKPYLPKEEFGNTAYAKISKEIIGINTGKRLALLLAPGNKLANSKDSDYIQVFLDDHIDISSNITTLVKMFYGNEEAKYAESRIKDYNKDNTIPGRKLIAKELSKKYPEIADYFDIEATDAQEYTTLNEHINVLWGQGRLSDGQYESIKNKITEQLKAESENKMIPKSSMLNYAEMKLVLQPVKPVHTGFKNEDRFDAMRMMYVKSSSFPLIPQITKGTELDKLRKMLENYEARTGKNVRASYQTANKVGAVSNPISPFLPNGTFNDSISDEQLAESSLVLSRDNFRIQQDVPFKSAKRNEDNVSLGTQTLKLLFGDGILDADGFELDGQKFNGKDLHTKFNDTYNNYISHRKKVLFKQLGVNEKGNPINVEDTMNKLQDLLKREAVDRGYPKQDVEALKLEPRYDTDGNIIDVQFSVPLWLSPNSNRYESLLNAIVSNKLVNVKLPGNSYVVGSEAGFKFQSDFNGVNQSNIVFTSKFTGELKAAEIEGGKLKKAQILLPSKFRDNNGNLIEFIDSNGNPNPTYTERDENGVLRLKEDMIDEQLLNITSFRIPTSGHVSMAQLDIVGILPTEVGDLMIVPKNLTKQKGLDFDIDKETTYQLHTYLNNENRIVPLDTNAKQELLKAADAKGTALLTDNSPESKLMQAIFGEDPDFKSDELDDTSFLGLLNDKIEQKLYENELVKIHSAVLSNPSTQVQKKINKVLSMDFAKGQAQLIQNQIEGAVDNTYFTMLSDTYQKEKMYLGASGKLGIGVYSNYVVFHSMIQQSDKPIQLLQFDEDGNKVPLEVQIGTQKSNGLLGRNQSLAPGKLKRSVAEIFAERQNTATDNEKEQIMGRVNVNELTINVDSLLSGLGFDKDTLDNGTEVSIPYLLLSQPVIKEYVEEIRKTQSNTTEFDSAAKDKVIAQLKSKYEVEQEYDTSKTASLLTGQMLFNNLTQPNKIIQLQVLDTFLMLDDYAKSIGLLQNKLNINRSGLGKSFFETIDKYYGIQNIIESNENNKKGIIVKNASNLVGDFVQKNEDLTSDAEQGLLNDGYIELGEFYIKPNNPVGSMLVNSVQAGYELWKDYFPYNDRNIKLVTDEILSMTSDESTSSQKVIEIQQNIFKEMKKYLVSSQKLGLFDNGPQKERNRFFIDSDTNTSLASYLRDVLSSQSDMARKLNSNKLLSRFEFQVNKNGTPSLIKFDNTKGENFDEDYLYIALIELMDQNKKLPDYNGNPYSTRQLAQDLIAYSYLEGGIQEAIQFAKYVPISYLNLLPFAGISREWNNKYRPGIFKNILGLNASGDYVSRFTRQYLQHNPQRLFKVDSENQIMNADYNGVTSGKLSQLTSFEIDDSQLDNVQAAKLNDAQFVTVYNPEIKKGLKKFQVYERIGNKYQRISTLGVFGMTEYSIREDDVKTNVNDYYKSKEPVKKVAVTKDTTTDIFGLKTNTLQEIVDNISNYDFSKYHHLKPIAKSLLPFLDNNVTIEVADILNSNGERIARGRYSTKENKITIDSYYHNTASNEDLAKTVLHELIHSLTSDYIGQYVDNQGNYKVPNPPQEIQKLVILFNETRRKLGPEIQKYAKKRQDQLLGETSAPTTERERTVAYAGTNIKEFVTLIMTEPNFQQEMMDVQYKSTDKNLFEKFAEILDSIMQKIFGENYNNNGVTAEGIRTSLEIVEKQSVRETSSPVKQMQENDMAAENILSTGFGDAIVPQDNDLDEPGENSIFEDPFICK